jgi:hypothetical protein
MRTAKLILTTLTLGTVLCATPHPAQALQLVTNWGFDTGITTWAGCCGATGTTTWDGTQDRFGSALSGSARLTHTQVFDGSPSSLFLTKCLTGADIAPGKQLVFGMRARFAPGEATAGQTYFALDFRPETDCSGSPLDGATSSLYTATSPRGTWLTIERTAASAVTVPAGTKALKIFVVATKTSAGTLTVNLDDVYVAAVGTPMCDGLPATQVGTTEYDLINGTSGSDVIVGKGGIDWIDGHEGNDHLCGGPGGDALYGGTGDDRLFGQGGKDTLLGAANDDLLDGGGNNDTLDGGSGKDKLRGGTGFDTCTDGLGTIFKTCEAAPAAG